MPAWMTLSRIARQMGAQGFDFACMEDLWQAAQADFPGFPDLTPLMAGPLLKGSNASEAPGSAAGEPYYMGFPLSQCVEGLLSLYSDPKKRGRA